MLGSSRKLTIMFFMSITTLLVIYISIVIINFFTEDEIINKEAIVGINPIVLTNSSKIYEEPLTILLKEKENKNSEKEKQVKEDKKSEEESKMEEVQLKKQEDDKKVEETKTAKIDVIVENTIETTLQDLSQLEEEQDFILEEYKGFETIGKIEIPQTGVNTPILNQVTVKGMENAPCLLYATGELNHNGNNLIVGHNYRNGTIFSDNKNLELGDKIYVTTLDGQKIEYTIYNKFVTTAEDVSYIKRDTNDKPEITLSCCTDDDEYRIIILAKLED